MPTPEELAREQIDAMLIGAGWTIQNFRELDLAVNSVALREVPLKIWPMRLPPAGKPQACRCRRSEKGWNSSFECRRAVTPLRGEPTGLSRDRWHSSLLLRINGRRRAARRKAPASRKKIFCRSHRRDALTRLIHERDSRAPLCQVTCAGFDSVTRQATQLYHRGWRRKYGALLQGSEATG